MPSRKARNPQLLFIDDEEHLLDFIAKKLTPAGYDVVVTSRWEDARSLLESRKISPEIIFVEPCFTDNPLKLEKLREIGAHSESIPVVVLSVQRKPTAIVQAVQRGVRDYIVKPFSLERLQQTIDQILCSRDREKSSRKPETAPSKQVQFVFSNGRMRRIHDTISQIADSAVPILIHGESGVGKEIIARLIHENSRLRSKPLVKVNCAALPAELTESELFGHIKGAFTGAHTDRAGKFEYAHGGTIFLDEIGEFLPNTQAKLLQVLQDGRFTRLGSNEEIQVDVRVIAATNRKLEKAIEEKKFRADLYYRLNVVNIEVPPLRERRDEIPLFCDYFLSKLSHQLNASVESIPKRLVECFQAYEWPGNVRELENLIKRYLILRDADAIRLELEAKLTRQVFDGIEEEADRQLEKLGKNLNLKQIAKEAAARVERNLIINTLCKTNWNKWQAAKELSVSYKTLLSRIELYNITPKQPHGITGLE